MLRCLAEGFLRTGHLAEALDYAEQAAARLEAIDARQVCTFELGELQGKPVAARVGRYGPYLQVGDGDERASLPEELPLARAILEGRTSQNVEAIIRHSDGREQRPAAQEEHPAQRRDRAEPARAGERQRVEAAREDERAEEEAAPRPVCQRSAGHGGREGRRQLAPPRASRVVLALIQHIAA